MATSWQSVIESLLAAQAGAAAASTADEEGMQVRRRQSIHSQFIHCHSLQGPGLCNLQF